MKRNAFVLLTVLCVLLFAGCSGLRLEPAAAQKQNAWLHERTAALAADLAREEDTSQTLQSLAAMSENQSRAMTAYFGMPDEPIEVDGPEDVLGSESVLVTEQTMFEASQRPDVWQAADAAIDGAIAVAGIIGGAWGIKAAGFLKTARQRSQALREVVRGSELFKQENFEAKRAFKKAQGVVQSPQTKQIVARLRNS